MQLVPEIIRFVCLLVQLRYLQIPHLVLLENTRQPCKQYERLCLLFSPTELEESLLFL